MDFVRLDLENRPFGATFSNRENEPKVMQCLFWCGILSFCLGGLGTDVMVQVDEKTAEQEKDKQKRWLGYGG